MENETITAVPGVAVGHSTDAEAATGVTVLTFPEPNVAVVDVRGGAPGTRQTDSLGIAIKPVTVNALMFAGGSAFGLAAADGVTAEIEKEGRGAPTPWGPVPIVPSAIVFDLMTGDVARRPGPEDGATAYLARTEDPAVLGRVGAGSGTTVAGWRGPDSMRYGGVGSAVVRLENETVGALVVLNAVGDVFSLEGQPLTGGLHASMETPVGPMPDNTTLVCIATDAGIDDRNELRRMAIRAHDALGACIRPTHTRYDGDSTFVVSFGDQPDPNIDMIQQAAFVVVGRAIESAINSVPDGAP